MTSKSPQIDERSGAEAETRAISGSSMFLVGKLLAIGLNTTVQSMLAYQLLDDDLGMLLLGMAAAGLVGPFMTFGQDRALSRHFVVFQEEGRRDRILGSMVLYLLTMVLSASIIFSLVVFAAPRFISGLDNSQARLVVTMMILLAPIEAIDKLMENLFAVFANPKTIFFRKYVLGPTLKLLVVGLLVMTNSNVVVIAAGLIAVSSAGLALYGSQLVGLFRSIGLSGSPRSALAATPVAAVMAFSVPMMASELLLTTVASLSATILAAVSGLEAVAGYRVVWPAVRLNFVVMFTFSILVTPLIARLHSRGEFAELNHAYWRISAWMAVASFPVFCITTVLATTTTRLLFGPQYVDSATVLAVLAVGAFLDVVVGFNQQTLQIHGHTKWVLGVNVGASALVVVGDLLLIPFYGAAGAAVAGLVGMLARNVINHLKMASHTSIDLMGGLALRVYGIVAAGLVAVWVITRIVGDGIVVGGLTVMVVWAAVVFAAGRLLDFSEAFPALSRSPLARLLGRS